VENWQKLSKTPWQEIRKMQDRKLRSFLINQIYPYSPYYRRLFDQHKLDPYKFHGVDDLVHIPFSYKEDVAPTDENPTKHRDFIIRPDEEVSEKYGHLAKLSCYGGKHVVAERVHEYKPVHMHFTTGRTAKSTPFVYSLRDLENIQEGGKRLFDVFALSKSDVMVNAFPYAPHLAFWQAFFAADSLRTASLHSGGGKVMGTQNLIDAVEMLRGTVLAFIPGYAYYFLRQAAEQKKDYSSVRKLLFGGERVPPGLKDKIRATLQEMGATDPMVLATYACTESRVAWGECPSEASFGYHVYPDLEIIELIDPQTGERVAEGEEGEIVYTALDWRGTCVLRYRTGDVAKDGITYAPCPNCGRTVPRISANLQRKSEFKEFDLTKIKGTLVNLNNFFPLMMGHPQVLEWQVEIRKRNNDPFDLDEIYLYLAPAAGVNVDELKNDLRQKIIRDTEVSPNDIIITSVEQILGRLGMETELKEKRILDSRPGK
jgi:phenylacetate-coenzyme A ligase PaaK-like adenylate-forming protein